MEPNFSKYCTVVNFGKTRDFSLKIRILKIFSRPTMCSNAKQRNWTFLPRRDFFNSEELSRIKSSPLGMSTFRFFVNEHFGVFCPLEKNVFRFVFVFEFKEKQRFVYCLLVKSLFLFLNVLLCFCSGYKIHELVINPWYYM